MFWQISKQLEAFYSFVYTFDLVAKLCRVSSRYEIKPLLLHYTLDEVVFPQVINDDKLIKIHPPSLALVNFHL